MAIFADIKTPYVDRLTTKRILSPAVKENIFQGIFTKPDEAVTEKFSEDTDASEIQVLRLKPQAINAREIGSDKNGGFFFDGDAATSATEAYPIRIIQSIDQPIDIPTNAQDMVSIDLLEGETRNLAGIVNRNINAMTIAAMIAKNFNNIAGVDRKMGDSAGVKINYGGVENAKMPSNWVTVTASSGKPTGKYSDAIIEAAAKLDEGNADEGIDAYPDDQRCVIIRPSVKAELMKQMTLLNGGTAVFDVLKKGGVDTESTPKIATTGYIGEFYNMPVYVASNVVWNLVEAYLGMTAGTLANLSAIVCSAVGTGRALAFNSAIKQVDTQKGQGIRIQPKYRFGAECWDAYSVVPIILGSLANPALGASNATDSTKALFVRGAASRPAT